MNNIDIGSYIEYPLEKGKEMFKDIKDNDKIRLNSCRAAILHAIKCYNVKKVWLAKYQCDVVKNFLTKNGIEVLEYDIDLEFNPLLNPNEKNTAIVLTNYFGIFGDKHFDPLIQKFNNIIIDNAQALFYHPRENCLNCYSPRKFVATPDGAYVIGKNVNKYSYPQDVSSNTCQFLLMRYEYGCNNNGYKNKKENDFRIDNSEIMLMSKLTYSLLDSFDYEKIIKIRQKNFNYSKKIFDKINLIDIENLADPDCVPMGYPLLIDDIDIISKFHEEHIYQARYWEYMLEKYSKNSLEYRLANRLALICTDQRYGKKEIDFQKNIVEKLLNEQESRNV